MLVAALLLAPGPRAPAFRIARDPYGVPRISAGSAERAYEGQGYAAAQDRLWQMELSRRLAEGRLAAVLGPRYAASDRDVLKLGYTRAEVEGQEAAMSRAARTAFAAYARGVNRCIAERAAAGALPPGYATNGFAPAPWTTFDSASVAIHLLDEFGTGGAGGVRNLALLEYLRTQPKLKGRALDVMDDLAWQNDPRALCTVTPADDPVRRRPEFPHPSRAGTLAQLAALPAASIFELLPAVQVALRSESNLVAERLAAPFRTGSYCLAIAGKRTASGAPMLISGPQMGFAEPSIVHEAALRAPGLDVAGMDVPGVPGIVVGTTRRFAWGLTSGVADVRDVFAFHAAGAGYRYAGKTEAFTLVRRTLAIKGQAPETLVQRRTRFGPVLVANANGAFALRSAYWGKELQTCDVLYSLYGLRDGAQLDRAVSRFPMSFNFFYATTGGEIGYRYTGLVPRRNPALDPRLPTPAVPADDWRGMIPPDQMPHVRDPKSGVLFNWNNKPAAWWPNGDTPVWGAVFHNAELAAYVRSFGARKLNRGDLKALPRYLAMHDPNWRSFAPLLPPDVRSRLAPFHGVLLPDRSTGAWIAFFAKLRHVLFERWTGNFLSESTFDLVIQPTVMLNAIEGRTKFDYLDGSARAAMEAAARDLTHAPAYRPSSFDVPGGPIRYMNRGTFIQVVELRRSGPAQATILPPGESESGKDAANQVALARRWGFKPGR